jgi:histidyl-tRNA synthetase
VSIRFQAIRGINDVLPGETSLWQFTEKVLQKICDSYAYQEIRLPLIEQTALFKRTIGEVTDIVEKEMYTFVDMNGDSISLRPEGTASCVRAMIEHGLLRQSQKVWYMGPMFRHEKPQKGRYRQFNQFGVEVFGIPEVSAELELLAMTQRIWKELDLLENISLQINCLGSSEDRAHYRAELVKFFKQHQSVLTEDELKRLEKNPLRLLDSKSESIQALLKNAPRLMDFISEESKHSFEMLCQGLDSLGIPYQINPYLVRGLDYYHDLVFEWVTTKLGSQATLCAGGRYNGLVEQLGGSTVPAVGFALGIERIILLQQAHQQVEKHVDVYLMTQEEQPLAQTIKIAESIRQQTQLDVEISLVSSSLKSQFKKADRSGAFIGLILGQEELQNQMITVKLLRQNEQENKQFSVSFNEINDWLMRHIKDLK